MSTHKRRDHRAPAFYVLIGTRACLARDDLLTVVISVVAAGIGNLSAVDMETSKWTNRQP